ncbi:NTP transferase domain-containing protein, partial [bacterium]|nr:NTP transferase domain-containing protein [bacterium]
MKSAQRQPQARRTLILCFGALMMLFSGLIYGWSIFVSPLEKAFGWNRGQTSFVFTLSMSVSILGQITGGFFVAKRRQRAILRVAAVLLAAGASTRFGSPKMLAPVGGEPLLRRVARAFVEAGFAEVAVVLAPGAAA